MSGLAVRPMKGRPRLSQLARITIRSYTMALERFTQESSFFTNEKRNMLFGCYRKPMTLLGGRVLHLQ